MASKKKHFFLYQPAHEKRVLITQTISKGSGMPAHKLSLARAFAVHRRIVETLMKPQTKMHIHSPIGDSTFDHNVPFSCVSSFMFLKRIKWAVSYKMGLITYASSGGPNELARKKGPYGFLVCCSSNAHAQSPIWATDTAVYLKKDVQEELQSQNIGT